MSGKLVSVSGTGVAVPGAGILRSVGLTSCLGGRVVARVTMPGSQSGLYLSTTGSVSRTLSGVAYNQGVHVRVWGDGAAVDLEVTDVLD